MPNRILKESINESKSLSTVAPFTQDLYKRLITYADDYGRFNLDTEIMRARLYPRELDAVCESEVLDALIELVGIGKVVFYTGGEWKAHEVFGYFPNWLDHQRLRFTRSKTPDIVPGIVNDWALKRFIPIDLKVLIFERDNFTCQECHQSYAIRGISTKMALRLMDGALHVDHIVPLEQGGRATPENLRLLCAGCNLSRKKRVSFDDLLRFAATCQSLPQPAAGGSNQRPEEKRSEVEVEEKRSEVEVEEKRSEAPAQTAALQLQEPLPPTPAPIAAKFEHDPVDPRDRKRYNLVIGKEPSPAVKEYLEACNSIGKSQTAMPPIRAQIDAIVKPNKLKAWREAVDAWLLHGYNPANVAGVLDFFQNGGNAQARASPGRGAKVRRGENWTEEELEAGRKADVGAKWEPAIG